MIFALARLTKRNETISIRFSHPVKLYLCVFKTVVVCVCVFKTVFCCVFLFDCVVGMSIDKILTIPIPYQFLLIDFLIDFYWARGGKRAQTGLFTLFFFYIIFYNAAHHIQYVQWSGADWPSGIPGESLVGRRGWDGPKYQPTAITNWPSL